MLRMKVVRVLVMGPWIQRPHLICRRGADGHAHKELKLVVLSSVIGHEIAPCYSSCYTVHQYKELY